MKFESLTPNIMVNDVGASILFYSTHFGFETMHSVPDDPPYAWAMIVRDDAVLMLQSVGSLGEDIPEFVGIKPGGAFTMFVKLEGVDELYAKVKGQLDIVSDIKDAFYGAREFSVRDLDGYILTFAEFGDED